MRKRLTLRDLPAIFRLAKKYRDEGGGLDGSGIRLLTKYGVPVTKRAVASHELGGATAAACFILPLMLFFTCSAQEFASQPVLWRLLESASPGLAAGFLFLLTIRARPAFALSLRHSALMGLIGYVPLCLIYNAAYLDTPRRPRGVLGQAPVDWTSALFVYSVAVVVTTVPAVLFAARRGRIRGSQDANRKLMVGVIALNTLHLVALVGYRIFFQVV